MWPWAKPEDSRLLANLDYSVVDEDLMSFGCLSKIILIAPLLVCKTKKRNNFGQDREFQLFGLCFLHRGWEVRKQDNAIAPGKQPVCVKPLSAQSLRIARCAFNV